MTENWPVYGRDPAHTGHGPNLSRPEWPVEIYWCHNLDGREAWQAPVLDSRGNAFVHAKKTQVNAPNFRAVTPEGTVLWALQTGHGWGPGAPSPTVADDYVVLPDSPDAWVVERRSGGRVHETSLIYSGVNHPHPTVVNGRIYVGFRAFDLNTGRELWDTGLEEPVYEIVGPDGDSMVYQAEPSGRAPAVVDGTVYVAGTMQEGVTRFIDEEDLEENADQSERSSLVLGGGPPGEYRDDYEEWGHVHAIDASDGTVKWYARVETPIRNATPAVVADGTVYVTDADRRLHALDANNGTTVWTADLGSDLLSGWRPAVADGKVFIGVRGSILALDAADGSKQWHLELEGDPAGPPAIVDGVVHASDRDGMVYAVETGGEERWRFDVERHLRTGPIVAGGRLFVAGQELICLASVG